MAATTVYLPPLASFFFIEDLNSLTRATLQRQREQSSFLSSYIISTRRDVSLNFEHFIGLVGGMVGG